MDESFVRDFSVRPADEPEIVRLTSSVMSLFTSGRAGRPDVASIVGGSGRRNCPLIATPADWLKEKRRRPKPVPDSVTHRVIFCHSWFSADNHDRTRWLCR